MTHETKLRSIASLQLDALLNNAPCSMAIVDPHMRYLVVSRLWEETLGIQRADVIGRNHYDLFPKLPDGRPELHQLCLQGETARCEAEPILWRDGSLRWLKWIITPWRDDHGSICGLVMIFEMVTHQVLLESELRRKDELYRTLVQQFPDAVVVVFDLDLRFILVEGAGLGDAQLSREETLGRRVQDALSPYASERLLPAYQRALRGETQHFEYLGRDGKTQFDVHVAPIRDGTGKITAGLGIARDITLHKKAQQLLIESELRYRMIVEDQSELILRFDATLHVTFANRAYLRFFTLDFEHVIGTRLDVQLPAVVFAAVEASLPQLGIGSPTQTLETKIKEPDKKSRWLAWTLRQITSMDGLTLEYQAVAYDITATKRAEKAERRLRALSDALREIAVVLHGTLDLNTVLDCIMDTIDRVVPHPFANVMLIQGEMAQIVRSRGYPPAVQRIALKPLKIVDYRPLQDMLESQQPLVIPTVQSTTGFSNLNTWGRVRSYVGTPILAQKQVIGFINLESDEPQFFKKKHAQQLHAFAEHAALAIRNAQLHQQFQDLAVWEERQRIARELHDAVSQTLFSTNMIADALPKLWRRAPDKVPQKLAELRQLTQIALMEMRSLLFELRPQTLVDIPLEQLIEQLVRTLEGRTSVKVDFQFTRDNSVSFPETIKIALYRIVQEAINNIVQHSKATKATINCAFEVDRVEIHIHDNGCGFDLSAPYPGHLGLRIMRERAETINATLQIESEPTSGTALRLFLLGTFIYVKEQP